MAMDCHIHLRTHLRIHRIHTWLRCLTANADQDALRRTSVPTAATRATQIKLHCLQAITVAVVTPVVEDATQAVVAVVTPAVVEVVILAAAAVVTLAVDQHNRCWPAQRLANVLSKPTILLCWRATILLSKS